MRLANKWAIPVLAGLLLAAQSAYATGDTLEVSLHRFFKQGVVLAGAKAGLIKVLRWPEIKQKGKGAFRWHLPHLRNHPLRVSLVLEQGTGERARRWYVPVQLHWWANALAVRDDIAARTLLIPSMLHTVHTDVADHTGFWWTDARQLVDTRTTRPLRGV